MMEKAIIAVLLALGSGDGAQIDQAPRHQEERLAALCLLSGEQVSGMNKICYYDCISGTVAITINWVKLCPLSIRR